MSKAYKISLVLLVLLLVLLTWLEANEPQEVNWSPSYAATDNIPLGTKVLFENLKQQDLKIQEVDVPPFEFLEDSTHTGTYLFLNNSLEIDKNELKRLLTWVEKGNTVFFIAENFSQNLLDTLNLENEVLVPKGGLSSIPLLNLTAPILKAEQAYIYKKETYQGIFSAKDSTTLDVLGVTQLKDESEEITDPKPNFIRDTIGSGMIYLHAMPKAFSNYFLLEDNNSEYVEKVLAYIPTQKTLFWDHYYKTGKSFYSSPLFVILNSKPLRWAYYFLIIGSILFIIFEGKRKQRSIPVINPLQNQTLDFTRTVAGLYMDREDYKSIASKKIALFLDYVRSHYRISTHGIDEKFYERLAMLSENSKDEVKKLWQFMGRLEKEQSVSKEELQQLNKAIKAFKKK